MEWEWCTILVSVVALIAVALGIALGIALVHIAKLHALMDTLPTKADVQRLHRLVESLSTSSTPGVLTEWDRGPHSKP